MQTSNPPSNSEIDQHSSSTTTHDETINNFIAFGSVWLDEIRIEDQTPILDVPGGSVTFATLGARLFSERNPRTITLLFRAGKDFPQAIINLFQSWSVELEVLRSPQPAARGIVFYEQGNGNRKGFQRLTPPLPLTLQDLTAAQKLHTKAFHIFGTATDVRTQFNDEELDGRDATPSPQSRNSWRVWEPHAKACLPENLQDHLKAAKWVNLFSPNHEELAAFFQAEGEDGGRQFDRGVVERQAAAFYQALNEGSAHSRGKGCVIVRAAGHGCMVMSTQAAPDETSEGRQTGESAVVWLPSYYSSDSPKVVDPTGAGNAFLGALAIGWQETGSFVEAAKYGIVAASFVIEQVGLPLLSGAGSSEQWNGASVRDRLEQYRRRLDNLKPDSEELRLIE